MWKFEANDIVSAFYWHTLEENLNFLIFGFKEMCIFT